MSLFRKIPKIDEFLRSEHSLELQDKYGYQLVKDEAILMFNAVREQIKAGTLTELSEEWFLSEIENRLVSVTSMGMRPVINGTGVVLHTNLGRAVLAEDVLASLKDTMISNSNLEFNLSNGKRGSRYDHVEEILCRLTGAEAALVVNNNAAAVLLTLDSLAKGGEVIVSRGQLVEIGGSFRVPDVMKASGCELVEVGTTNKTHARDYENAITEETSLIMKVHTSNYKISGFTSVVEIPEMVEIAGRHDLFVYDDLGSGSLINMEQFGLPHEPTVLDSLKEGADIVSFSGDKMLGSTQAGIIVGKRKLIDKLKKNQLTRALRVDKLTLVVLEKTLRLMLNEQKAIKEIPTLSMLAKSYDDTVQQANDLMHELQGLEGVTLAKVDIESEVGGGSMPMERMPSCGVEIVVNKRNGQWLADKLRMIHRPIIGRIIDDKVVIDMRTVHEREYILIKMGLEEVCRER